MGLVVRLYGIVSPNPFKVSIKKGDLPYPLDNGYEEYSTTYSGGTTQIELAYYRIVPPGLKTEGFLFNQQYWVKITDLVTDRYIIENIYTNDQIAFECSCTPPLILSVECFLGDLDCNLTLTAEYVP